MVGLKGVVAFEETLSAVRMPPSNSCAVEIACLYEPNSDKCQSQNPSVTASGLFVSDDEGHVFACDSSNMAEEELRCNDRLRGQCFQSSAYTGCSARYAFTSDFQNNPNIFFANSNAQDLKDMEDHYYAVFYSDDECMDLAGLKAFYSEEEYILPVTGDDV